jgi:hypothetical protein
LHRRTYATMIVDANAFIGKQLKKAWSWNGDQESPPVRGQRMHGVKVADLDDVAVESMGYFFPPQLSGRLFEALPK